MEAYLIDWASLLVRWLHVITGVAWIGASFYFVMLDNSLRAPVNQRDLDKGVSGELWAVHGGGLYHSQKYLVGPVEEPLSEHLHWSKYEAYSTWLSGMGLLAIIYWFGAETYLIDRQVMALSAVQAIAISIAVIVVGWLVYNALCRLLNGRDNMLAASIFVFVIGADWLLFQLFSARAAYLHVGAMMGSIMVFNVFFHIIPGQKRMVAQMRAGKKPDAEPGIIGKQRSVHNTYFTLPVLFIMISGHYSLTYSHPQGWLVLGFIMIAGVLIRQFFVLRHRGQRIWALPVIGILLLLTMIWYLRPAPVNDVDQAMVSSAEIQIVLQNRCSGCHARQPTLGGFSEPPLGVVLETEEQIEQYADKIATTVRTRYMPLGNLTAMTDDERNQVAVWHTQVRQK